jgi:DNA-binding PadR family transcriptional regulator
MHGYEANAELERRQIRDWADLSRPQIYYSLDKLAAAGFIRAKESSEPLQGPERRVFATTAAGRNALADALEREDWVTHRDRPPFLTWMALSWLARPSVMSKQIERRRAYLDRQIAHERETIEAVKQEVGHEFHEAVWMITLMIEQFETELRWLGKVERELDRRASAKHPKTTPNT